jgi:hypothetical protein
MLNQFNESFKLSCEFIFSYFRDPASWVRLYGELRPVRTDSNGWSYVSLKRFPFPLKARVVHCDENQKVRWEFSGFWRGVAEINFQAEDFENGLVQTRVFGFEYIVPFGFWFLEGWIAASFMQKEFERIWAIGWKRLRKSELKF